MGAAIIDYLNKVWEPILTFLAGSLFAIFLPKIQKWLETKPKIVISLFNGPTGASIKIDKSRSVRYVHLNIKNEVLETVAEQVS